MVNKNEKRTEVRFHRGTISVNHKILPSGNLTGSSCGDNMGDLSFWQLSTEAVFTPSMYSSTHTMLITHLGGQCRTRSISDSTFQRPALKK